MSEMSKMEVARKSKRKMRANEQAFKRASRRIQGGRIELYQREDDPGSHVVRTRLSELGLDYTAHSVPVDNPLKHEELTQAGGKDQVPFLFDHRTGVKLYEPQPILEYLDKEYGHPSEGTLPVRIARELENRVRSRADEIAWALRAPIDQARTAGMEMKKTLDSLKRSYQVIRDSLLTPLNKSDSDAA